MRFSNLSLRTKLIAGTALLFAVALGSLSALSTAMATGAAT